MDFHSPERKRLQDAPMYLEHYSVLPHLMVYPGDVAGDWILSCFLPSVMGHSYYQLTCKTEELTQHLLHYRQDPEEFFRVSFHWTVPVKATLKAKTSGKERLNLTLADLGL